MNEKCHPITDEFIEEFLLRAQHHSGLPLWNRISRTYVAGLTLVTCPDRMLPDIMDSFLNGYMCLAHEVYRRTKTWKSYDW